MKQTSIEWLDEQIQEYVIAADHVANTMVIQISFEEYMDLKRQAKEMHKAEIGNKLILDEEFNKIYSQLMRTQKLSLYDDKISNDYQLGYLHGVQWIYQILKERQ
jgi:hypothetical protein